MEFALQAALMRLQRKVFGFGPKKIRVRLIDDWLLVVLEGVLTPAERQVIASDGACRDLIKKFRTQLVEAEAGGAGRGEMREMIATITGQEVVSMHHDLSTRTGEEVLVFRLSAPPNPR